MKIGLPGAVFLVFLILKLTNHIAWSWWLVTAPLWGGLAFALAFMVGVAVVAAVAVAIEAWRSR